MTISNLDTSRQTSFFPLRSKIKKQKAEVADTGSLSQNREDSGQPDLMLVQTGTETTLPDTGKETGGTGTGTAMAGVGVGTATGASGAPLLDLSKVIGVVGGVNITTGGALVAGGGIVVFAALRGGVATHPLGRQTRKSRSSPAVPPPALRRTVRARPTLPPPATPMRVPC